MKKIIIFTILVLVFIPIIHNQAGLPAIALAKADILDGLPGPEIMPDSPFYKIKIWYEKFIIFISFGDVKKAERYSKIAERRLYEAEKMAEKGKEELTKRLLEEYEKYLNKALARAEKIAKKAQEEAKQKVKEKINQALEKVSESTLKNQNILLKVYELVPDEARGAIERVIEITKKGYEQAVKSVSGVKKEELKQQAEEFKIRAKELIKDWQKIFGE
jgi:vacuolar-type H+-ATPase subunit H